MSSANEAASLRAELKGFERDFKAKHGHAPSVDDIKQAGFAERYKLYKKLSKASSTASNVASSSKSYASQPPPPTKSIVPRSRAQPVDTASASNPFSPRKDKSKQRVLGSPSPSPSHRLPNPFATPGKPKPRRAVSPAPLPALALLAPDPEPEPEYLPPPKTKANGHSKVSNPVSRARKRLRGEPVSPSPVKLKRPRTEDTSQTVLPFPSLASIQNADSDEEDDYDGMEASTSFVEASPRKGGTPFTILFDDAPLESMPIPSSATMKKSRSKSASQSQNQNLFRSRTRSPSRSSDDLPVPIPAVKPKPAKRRGGPAFSLGRGDLYDAPAGDTSTASSKGKAPARGSKRSTPSSAREDEDGESMEVDASPPPPSSDAGDLDMDLLPPSPPGKDSGSTSYRGKGKGRASGSRKKSKMVSTAQDDTADESSDAAPVKLRESFLQGRTQNVDDSDEDMQPEPLFRPGAPIDMPPFEMSQQMRQPSSPSQVQVEYVAPLPDAMHEAMDLARREGGMEGADIIDEEQVAHGIMSGERLGWYDAKHGGEVWDVGEWTEGESEDWEGEPVPWAAGEL